MPAGTMSEVILVRPGHTDFDEQCRIQGLLDLPLNERGHEYVESLVDQFDGQAVDVILTDPGEPARTTAERLGDALDVSVKDVPALRNLDLGLWQGLLLDEVRRKYPKLLKQWSEHPETICPPQGEPVCEAMSRIAQALKKPLRKYKRIVIVAADPLATLIAGVMRGTKPDFKGPMCSHAGRGIETLSSDLSPAVATVPGSPSTGVAFGERGGISSGSQNGKVAAETRVNGRSIDGMTQNNVMQNGESCRCGDIVSIARGTPLENGGHEFRG